VSQEVGSADGSVVVHRDGAILRLTLDRPARRNSLSHPMVDALVGALTDAASDDGLRVVHIRGEGDDFCAGADWVATNSGGQRPRTGDLVRRIPHTAHRLIELVHSIQLPVVCSVRGWAAGIGLNLALAADFTVAADDARFWAPFVDTLPVAETSVLASAPDRATQVDVVVTGDGPTDGSDAATDQCTGERTAACGRANRRAGASADQTA